MENKKLPIIILSNPQLPENIGLSARAMMGCGFKNLRIINPREKWPNSIAQRSSAHANNIIKKTKLFKNFDEAISDLNFVIGTTVRKRIIRKKHLISFPELIENLPNDSKTGIVFGPERSGLTNIEISKCDLIFSLPIHNNEFSLNLSQAVLLICYEINKLINKDFFNKKTILKDIAPKKDFTRLMNHLIEDLDETGFFYPKIKKKGMILNIRNMFLRANFSSQEIRTFRGILRRLKKPRH